MKKLFVKVVKSTSFRDPLARLENARTIHFMDTATKFYSNVIFVIG